MTNLEMLEEVIKEAHKEYLKIWSIQTQIAENDGNWNQDIQHQILESLKNTNSTTNMFAAILVDIYNEEKTSITK